MLVVRAVRDLEARRWSRRSPAERAAPCHLPDAAAEGCDLLGRKSAGFGVRGLGKLGSEDFTNAHGGLFHVLVLPDPEDSPSQGVQMSIGLTIPFDVAREFRRPPCGVVRGDVLCSGHPCQKQPSTNTATFARVNRTSARRRGSPGRGWSTRYLKPRRWSSRRRSSSGSVSRLCCRAIRAEVPGSTPTSGPIGVAPALGVALVVGGLGWVPSGCMSPTSLSCPAR